MQIVSSGEQAKQTIHIKCQDLFSLKRISFATTCAWHFQCQYLELGNTI